MVSIWCKAMIPNIPPTTAKIVQESKLMEDTPWITKLNPIGYQVFKTAKSLGSQVFNKKKKKPISISVCLVVISYIISGCHHKYGANPEGRAKKSRWLCWSWLWQYQISQWETADWLHWWLGNGAAGWLTQGGALSGVLESLSAKRLGRCSELVYIYTIGRQLVTAYYQFYLLQAVFLHQYFHSTP